MSWLKKLFPPRETFVVQLHVNTHSGVVSSFTEIPAKDLIEARRVAMRLRQDNR